MTYSVAIRTLALSPDTLKQTLEGVFAQTLPPEKVIIYIARGYTVPSWRVGHEQYVCVDKGMMRQRALPYKEIESDYILMLDDDLLLSPSAASRMMATAEAYGTDLLGADPFENHKMSRRAKLSALITAWVTPHFSDRKAFKLRSHGSFSYINSPRPKFYPSDTCAGPIMLWRRDSFLRIGASDETWIDTMGYPYSEDALLSYKATANGMKVGIDFGVGLTNLDSRTSSDVYRNDPQRFYIRTRAIFSTWWRMCCKPYGNRSRSNLGAMLTGSMKYIWLMPVMLAASVASRSFTPFTAYLRGLRDAYRYVHSEAYMSLPPYIRK